MNTDEENIHTQENNSPEEERVTAFMQALQRMHEDPAEAARIDKIIEDAEHLTDETVRQDLPLAVHIHNQGGSYVVNLSPSFRRILDEPDPRKSIRQRIKLRRPNNRTLWQLGLIPTIVALSAILATFMSGHESQRLWAVVTSAVSVIALIQVWAMERFNAQTRRPKTEWRVEISHSKEVEAREFNNL
ncbi:hypothetical protein [Streptomyces alboflavus]|uniref:hypothetical protein n=1 Tax=Streptomyces alboflavus TaxID=67267 RepID=UPI0004C25B5F|nr:hypothetical protein [Streptomyces alboflavus]